MEGLRAMTGLQRDNSGVLRRSNRAILLSRPLILLGKASQATRLGRRSSHLEETCSRSEPRNSRDPRASASTPALLMHLQRIHLLSSQPHNLQQLFLLPALEQISSTSIKTHLRPQARLAQHQRHNKTSLQILHSRSAKHLGSHRPLAPSSLPPQHLICTPATSLALLKLPLRPLN